MALLDLLGRRWSLRILWERRGGDAATFAELRERCDAMSPSVLNLRIAELRDAGIIDHRDGGYRLTEEGKILLVSLAPLTDWAKRWTRRM